MEYITPIGILILYDDEIAMYAEPDGYIHEFYPSVGISGDPMTPLECAQAHASPG